MAHAASLTQRQFATTYDGRAAALPVQSSVQDTARRLEGTSAEMNNSDVTPGLAGSSRSGALRGWVVPPAALSETELAAWRGMLPDDPALGSPFLSPGFALAVSRVRPGVRVCVLRRGADRNGEPVGFLPFQYGDALSRMLGLGERVGDALNDHFGLVAQAGLVVQPAELLRLAGLSSLEFSHLDQAQTAYGLTGEQPELGRRVVLADMAGGSAAAAPPNYWEQLRLQSKRFVADTERRERKLVEAHGKLRFTLDAPAEPWLERLIEAKRGQYVRTGVGDVLAVPEARLLLQTLAGQDDPDCRGMLSTLEAGDTWAALHFGLRRRGILHYWFLVHNRDLDLFSPGRLLLRAILNAAPEAGLQVVDFGAGDAQYKRQFGNADYHVTRGLWRRDTPRALLSHARLSLRWRRARRRSVAAGAATAAEAS